MSQKLIFVDMDGTLYQTENDVIPQSALDTLAALKAQGHEVWAATGRPLNAMRQILEHVNPEEFQFDGYVLINGGYILDNQFNIINESPISNETLEDLIQMTKDKKLGLMIHFGDATYIYNEFYSALEFAQYTNSLEGLFYDPTMTYHHRHPAYNCLVVTKDPADINEFVASHPELRKDLINNISTSSLNFDLFPSHNDKSVGIESILKMKGKNWNDVVVIGDSTNDMIMLEKAGLGIAMGSASDKVKAKADFVTTSNREDGIANAQAEIEKFAAQS